MATSKIDSGIRAFSLVRRVGSILTVGFIFLLFVASIYNAIREKIWLSDLKEITENGISQRAEVEGQAQIQYIGGFPRITLKYGFTEGDRKYSSEYTLFGTLPQSPEGLSKLFTVHYLKDDPSTSSLNIEDEMARVEKSINDSSVLWFYSKIFIALILTFILLGQFMSLISELRNINKPIEIPDYLKADAVKGNR
jgi:hypothetical protein